MCLKETLYVINSAYKRKSRRLDDKAVISRYLSYLPRYHIRKDHLIKKALSGGTEAGAERIFDMKFEGAENCGILHIGVTGDPEVVRRSGKLGGHIIIIINHFYGSTTRHAVPESVSAYLLGKLEEIPLEALGSGGVLNEKEPYHSYEDPFEEGEVCYKIYCNDDHIVIHYMESIPEACGYTEPLYSSRDSDKKKVNPMEDLEREIFGSESLDSEGDSPLDPTYHMEYRSCHQELMDHLIKAAHQIGQEADTLCEGECKCS